MNNKTKKKSKLKLGIWLVCLALVASLLTMRFMSPKEVLGQEISATKGNLTTYYSFSGSVEAKNKQTIFADKAMQIKDIKVEQGALVKKDDVLMTTLYGQEIKAELEGEVSKIYAEENAQLMPGSKLIDIVDYSDLKLTVKVDEYDLASISKDKEAAVTIHALSKDVRGSIAEVAKEGTYMNGVTFFEATIDLEEDSDIKVGMTAEAKVLDKSVTNALLLPVSAINFDANNKAYVYVKGDKAVKSTELEIGLTDGTNAEILKGITESDIILLPQAEQQSLRPPFARGGNQEGSDGSSSGGN